MIRMLVYMQRLKLSRNKVGKYENSSNKKDENNEV